MNELIKHKSPSGSQKPQRETVSIEVIKADAVAVWYGSIESTHALISTGLLSIHITKK